jgi:predicted enzyme related to lactoylglutathione lyase
VRSRSADWISLHPLVPRGPHLAFQVVPETKVGKNRLHLDVNVDDLAAATTAAEQLGAQRLGGVVEEEDGRFQVMADPAGNEFCLVEWDELGDRA